MAHEKGQTLQSTRQHLNIADQLNLVLYLALRLIGLIKNSVLWYV